MLHTRCTHNIHAHIHCTHTLHPHTHTMRQCKQSRVNRVMNCASGFLARAATIKYCSVFGPMPAHSPLPQLVLLLHTFGSRLLCILQSNGRPGLRHWTVWGNREPIILLPPICGFKTLKKGIQTCQLLLDNPLTHSGEVFGKERQDVVLEPSVHLHNGVVPGGSGTGFICEFQVHKRQDLKQRVCHFVVVHRGAHGRDHQRLQRLGLLHR
mmetsp:Transcript_101764/g.172381  ORF Transcript_101764/g.172381 Transcript_101764/m.172381 type:complete len:210 (+) Transcript_101764:305-934(+)